MFGKTRIVLLFPISYPQRGGAATYLDRLEQLLPVYLEQIVITSYLKKSEKKKSNYSKDSINRRHRFLFSQLVEKKNTLLRYAAKLFDNFMLLCFLLWYRPAYIHVHRVCNYHVIPLIKYLLPTTIILDIRDSEQPKRMKWFDWLATPCLNYSQRLAVEHKYAGKVTSLGLGMNGDVVKRLAKIHLDGLGEHIPYILFVGDICERKGVSELIEAIMNLKNYKLVLIGRLVEEKFLLLFQESPNLIYLGPMPSDKVYSYMSKAMLLILPSRKELVPRVCIEAHILGTKVLCTPNTIMNISKEHTLNSIDAVEIAKRIKSVLSAKEEQKIDINEQLEDNLRNTLTQIYG